MGPYKNDFKIDANVLDIARRPVESCSSSDLLSENPHPTQASPADLMRMNIGQGVVPNMIAFAAENRSVLSTSNQ